MIRSETVMPPNEKPTRLIGASGIIRSSACARMRDSAAISIGGGCQAGSRGWRKSLVSPGNRSRSLPVKGSLSPMPGRSTA